MYGINEVWSHPASESAPCLKFGNAIPQKQVNLFACDEYPSLILGIALLNVFLKLFQPARRGVVGLRVHRQSIGQKMQIFQP